MASRNQEIISLLKKHWPFLIIFLGAAVIRFWNLGQADFSHDELSALFRTRYDSFSELIREGIRVDGHPALVQVFLYYWAPAVDYSEFWVKLPSVLLGLGSIVLVYASFLRIRDADASTLLVVSLMAFSQLFVYHHQTARPYAYGAFFVALCAYGYFSWFYKEKKNEYLVLFGLGAVLAAYSHYLALLTVLIIGLTALIKDIRAPKPWILVFLISLAFFSPHLEIFFYQLSLGGVGQWLGPPDASWLTKFLSYLFNFSIYSTAPWIGIAFLGLIFFGDVIYRPHGYGLIWFGSVFTIAFLYSIFRNPVLQYSSLIFVTPYLFVTPKDEKKAKDSAHFPWLVVIFLIPIIWKLFKNDDRYFMREAHISPPKEAARILAVQERPVYYHWDREKWEFYRSINPDIPQGTFWEKLPNSLPEEAFFLISDHSTPGYWPAQIEDQGLKASSKVNHFGFQVCSYLPEIELSKHFSYEMGRFEFSKSTDDYELISALKPYYKYTADRPQTQVVVNLEKLEGAVGSALVFAVRDPESKEQLAWYAYPIEEGQRYFSQPVGQYPITEYDWRILLDHSQNPGTCNGKLRIRLMTGNDAVYGLVQPVK